MGLLQLDALHDASLAASYSICGHNSSVVSCQQRPAAHSLQGLGRLRALLAVETHAQVQ